MVASILVAGLMVATVAFWILSRSLGKFAGPPTRSDAYEDEMDGYIAVKAIPIPPDDTSTPSEDGS